MGVSGRIKQEKSQRRFSDDFPYLSASALGVPLCIVDKIYSERVPATLNAVSEKLQSLWDRMPSTKFPTLKPFREDHVMANLYLRLAHLVLKNGASQPVHRSADVRGILGETVVRQDSP